MVAYLKYEFTSSTETIFPPVIGFLGGSDATYSGVVNPF
jgi:hypothetical protein